MGGSKSYDGEKNREKSFSLTYHVEISKPALKEMLRLPLVIYKRVEKAINELETTPRPVGCKKLKGYSDRYRIRLGNYRIVYIIKDKILYITIIGISDRKDAYK